MLNRNYEEMMKASVEVYTAGYKNPSIIVSEWCFDKEGLYRYIFHKYPNAIIENKTFKVIRQPYES